MEKVRKFLKELKENQGEPREGFDEYLKKCVPWPFPTLVPDLSKFFLVPEGEILQDVMVQPFYDSKTLKAKDSDVLVVSYPKSGTTWTQEIAYLISHDVNFEKATSAPIETRFPFLETPFCGIRGIEKAEEPRLIKSHRPYDFLPPSFIENKTKVIYIARNPKDTIVSYFHFLKMVGYTQYSGSFEEFVNAFCEERLLYSSFARNVLSFWNRRNESHILFLFYEDLQKDLKSNVQKIAQFLGKSLTDEQLDQVVDHCTFDSMKKNPMSNYSHGGSAVRAPDSKTEFLRKGKTGDWRNYFNDELSEKVDDYVEKHFKGSGIVFDYEV